MSKVTYALLRIELDPDGGDIDELLHAVVKLHPNEALTMIDVISFREITEGDDADQPVIYWP